MCDNGASPHFATPGGYCPDHIEAVKEHAKLAGFVHETATILAQVQATAADALGKAQQVPLLEVQVQAIRSVQERQIGTLDKIDQRLCEHDDKYADHEKRTAALEQGQAARTEATRLTIDRNTKIWAAVISGVFLLLVAGLSLVGVIYSAHQATAATVAAAAVK